MQVVVSLVIVFFFQWLDEEITIRSKEGILQLRDKKRSTETRVQELEGHFQEFEVRNDELLKLIDIYEKEAKERGCMEGFFFRWNYFFVIIYIVVWANITIWSDL